MHPKKPTAAKVQIVKNGPYLVSGALPLQKQTIGTNPAGESVKWLPGPSHPDQTNYALCRCGHSANKPYCDGSHAKVGFDGTETASRASYREQAELQRGPTMSLTDAQSLCAFARFCDPHGQIWNLVNQTDPAARKVFVQEAGDCPSGRLVAWDNETGQAIEPAYEPSIGLIEDPANACSGPIWLRGGIPVTSSDGHAYEVRNRVTLCRCGASKNKPFCDGTHAAIHFRDDK
jgi:CDGSH-type Zn-finger protein